MQGPSADTLAPEILGKDAKSDPQVRYLELKDAVLSKYKGDGSAVPAAELQHAVIDLTLGMLPSLLSSGWGDITSLALQKRNVDGTTDLQWLNAGSYNVMYRLQPPPADGGPSLVARLPALRPYMGLTYAFQSPCFTHFMQARAKVIANEIRAGMCGGARVVGLLPVKPVTNMCGVTWRVLSGGELMEAVEDGNFAVATLYERGVDVYAGTKELVQKGLWTWPSALLSLYGMASAMTPLLQAGFFHPDLKPNNFLIEGLPQLVQLLEAGLWRDLPSKLRVVACDNDATVLASDDNLLNSKCALAFMLPERFAGAAAFLCTSEQMMVGQVARSCDAVMDDLNEDDFTSDLTMNTRTMWEIDKGRRPRALGLRLGYPLPAELLLVLAGSDHPVASRRLALQVLLERARPLLEQALARHPDTAEADIPTALIYNINDKTGTATSVLSRMGAMLGALCDAHGPNPWQDVGTARDLVRLAVSSLWDTLMQLSACSWKGPHQAFMLRLLRVTIAALRIPKFGLSKACDSHGRTLLHRLVMAGNAAAVRTLLEFGCACGKGELVEELVEAQDENGDTAAHLGLRHFLPDAVLPLLHFAQRRAQERVQAGASDPAPDWLLSVDKDARYTLLHLIARAPLGGAVAEQQRRYDERFLKHQGCLPYAYEHPTVVCIWPALASQFTDELHLTEERLTAVLRSLGSWDQTRSQELVNADLAAADALVAALQGTAAAADAYVPMSALAETLLTTPGLGLRRLFVPAAGEDTPLHLQAALGCGEGLQLLCELGGDAAEACVGRTNADGRTPHQEARWCNPWLTTKAGGKLLRLSVRVDEYNDPVREPNVWDSAAGLRRWLRAVQGCADAELEELVEAVIAGREQGQ